MTEDRGQQKPVLSEQWLSVSRIKRRNNGMLEYWNDEKNQRSEVGGQKSEIRGQQIAGSIFLRQSFPLRQPPALKLWRSGGFGGRVGGQEERGANLINRKTVKR